MNQKRNIIFCAVFLSVLFLSGCQPTPEIPPVVNRSEGISDESVLEPLEGDERKPIDAPLVWTEEIYKGEGRVIIQSEQVELKIPEVQNTPVLEVQEQEFDEELLRQLTDYFAGDSLLYAAPAMTKEELNFWSDWIQERRGIYGHPNETPWISFELSNIRYLIESAPDTIEKRYVQPEFGPSVLSEYKYVMVGKKAESTEADTFKAVVEDNQALITAERRNDESGTSSSFSWENGSYLDSSYLENAEDDFAQLEEQGNAQEEWLKEYQSFLERLTYEIKSAETELNKEVIIKQSERTLEELGITELTLADIRPCIVTSDSLQWDSMNVNWDNIQKGYVVEYARSCGELTASLIDGSFYYYDTLPEKTYSPKFFPESVTLVYAGQELKVFEWSNMASLAKVVAQNTRLLPFDEIKERFAQHLFYIAAAQDEKAGRDMDVVENYVVTDVRLMAYYTDAYGNPQNAWVVPIWLFTYDYYRTVNGEERYIGRINTMMNAIDGGYIQLAP